MNLGTCMFQYNFERVNNCLNEVDVKPCGFHLKFACCSLSLSLSLFVRICKMYVYSYKQIVKLSTVIYTNKMEVV